MFRSTVGLDIGDNHVRAVEITRDLKVKKIGRCFISHSRSKNKDMLSEKVRWLFEHYGFARNNVVINLHGSQIITRTYRPPSIENDAFERWFVENADTLIPGVVVDGVIFDHEFLASGRVLISYAKRDVVEDRLKILAGAGILPTCIDASCLALYRAFAGHPWIKEKKDVVILDVRPCHSDIIMIINSEPFVSSEVPVGMNHLKSCGNDIALFSNNLAAHIIKIVDYYRTREDFEMVNCLLTGGARKTRSLRKHLARHLGMVVEHGFFSIDDEQFKHGRDGYAQALGLALSGVSIKAIKRVNLMPPEKRELHRRWQFYRMSRQFFTRHIAFAGIALLLFLLIFGVCTNNNKKMAMKIVGLEAQKQTLLAVNTEENEYQQKITKLQELRHDRVSWTETLNFLGAAVPAGIYLTGLKTESRLVTNQSGTVKTMRIIIEGEAINKNDVLSFVKNLEPHFNKIAVDNITEDVKCEFKILLAL